MTIYALKPRFQALLRPLATALARSGISANQVTVATCVASLAIAAWVALQAPRATGFILIAAWMPVRMALNALDGMLARDFGQQTRLGAYLNELTDVVADAALIAPFALLPPNSPAWTAAVIVLAALTEYAGVLGPSVGASRRYDGPLGKSDRAFVFGVFALWAAVAAPLPAWAAWIMPLIAAALISTIVNRVRGALREDRHE